MRDLLARARELVAETVAHRRYLHQNPELGEDLPVTLAYVAGALKKLGYMPQSCGPCGLIATVGAGAPVFLLRADMDALPMPEESGLPFASPYPDKAHTCGHDMHAAMLLTAARLLKEEEPNLKGTVKLMFQPGEETMGGAQHMVEAGALQDPPVEAALAIHVDATQPLDRLLIGDGYAFASNDFFTVTVTGKGGHAARPADGVDPVNVAAHIQLAFQTLISREAQPFETNVISVTAVEAGGGAYNIIPDTAVMRGTLRTYNADQRTFLKERLVQVAEGIAGTFRASAAVEFQGDGVPALWCDGALSADLRRYADEMLGQGAVWPEPFRKVGSEDFVYVSRRVRAGYFFVGSGPDREHPWPYGQHHPKVVQNEEVLPRGAALLAQAAIRYLEEHG